MCGLKRIVGPSVFFSARFIELISHYIRIGCDIGGLRRAACLVVGPVTVGGFAFLFGCAPLCRTWDSVAVSPCLLVGW